MLLTLQIIKLIKSQVGKPDPDKKKTCPRAGQWQSRQEPDLWIPSPVIVSQHWGFAQAQESDSNMAGHVTSFKSLLEKI